jgi:hypothetical protein
MAYDWQDLPPHRGLYRRDRLSKNLKITAGIGNRLFWLCPEKSRRSPDSGIEDLGRIKGYRSFDLDARFGCHMPNFLAFCPLFFQEQSECWVISAYS